MQTLQPSLQIDLFQMASTSTLSPEAIPASPSVMRASSLDNQTPGTFGLTCSDLFESPDPSTYLPKMLRDTFSLECPTYAGSWKQKTIESGHSLFRLAPQERVTYATEFSLSDKDTLKQIRQRMGGSAAPVIETFLTDASVTTVKDYAASVGSGHTRSTTRWLTAALTAERTGMFPTPTANEDATGRPGSKMQIMLGNHPSVRDTTKKVLSPEWTELLMGFPEGWTDLEP